MAKAEISLVLCDWCGGLSGVRDGTVRPPVCGLCKRGTPIPVTPVAQHEGRVRVMLEIEVPDNAS